MKIPNKLDPALQVTEAIEVGVYTQISMIESTEAFKKFANGKSWNQIDFKFSSKSD